MGEVKWTPDQKRVIEARNANILVSAAAGSGKTAVLVERIVDRITSKENPIDIDRMLVVTFTKAAAAEMRERVINALEKKKEQFPDDENLDRQMTLVHNAQITTIDSFCVFVARNYFEKIGLDPNFRIADSGEVKLLEEDVLTEVFEDNYVREDNEAFLQLIDAYAGSRSDQAVRDMVSKIYHQSASDSWPKEWIENLSCLYEVEEEEELLKSQIMREIISYVKEMLCDARKRMQMAYEMVKGVSSLVAYEKHFEPELAFFEGLDEVKGYNELKDFLEKFSWKKMPTIRGEFDVQKKEGAQGLRTDVKKTVEDLAKKYFSMDLEKILLQIKRVRPYAEELVRLSLEYLEAMEKAKRKKHIADFADVEHFALRIFVDEKTKQTTETAKEFQRQFDEIMIDEYQDSNQVQEDIMCAISGIENGNNNMFMVGDVKQSIYRFRLARPELFMKKYHEFANQHDDKNIRIDLKQNFRSRKEILDVTNDIFYKIMLDDLGKVSYDADAALYLGATYYPKKEDEETQKTELLLLDLESVDEEGLEEGNKKLEAHLVAKKIHDMMKNQMVMDKATGHMRPMRYSDIVILFRSLKEWGTDFAAVLEDANIPCHVTSQTGYFSAYEVQIVLNMLRILDNPYQDIPMAAVLKSPIVGLDNEELAELQNRELGFSRSAMNAMKEATEGKLYEFNKVYHELRQVVKDTPIHEVLELLFEKTGIRQFMLQLPAGEKRGANLDMLLEKAITYESTSYKGLFHFVRYIDNLQKYEVDFGEADVSGEGEDVVHIMTIHKSKGLEFPVVFVSGIGKQFNEMDVRDGLVVHPEYGLGINEMTVNPRTKRKSLIRTEIAECMKRENIGEELRVLYVALTRAKEKLILTGTVKDATKEMEKHHGVTGPCALPFATRVGAKSYLDWLIPSFLSYPDKYEIQFEKLENLILEKIEEKVKEQVELDVLMNEIQKADDSICNEIKQSFSYIYPHQSEAGKKSKYSVSEIKHASMKQIYDDNLNDAEKPDFLKTEKESFVPDFAKKIDGITESKVPGVSLGALRGTAVHRVMQCLDFVSVNDLDVTNQDEVKQFVEEQLQRMLQNEEITKEMYQLVLPILIEKFLVSPVAMRMAKAAKRGELFKEKPFVMKHQDGYLVQGIVDVFWFEEDEIVVLDYKTDYVTKGQELIDRYKVQLELYADALCRVFSTDEKQKNVKECMIYSFRLQEEISI